LAVFTAFNTLANYKFPLNEALCELSMSKQFKLSSEEIINIAIGYGGCIATDMITVEGHKVGYMYRDESSNKTNGWVFMAGCETQEYMDNAKNLAMYDTNTIANYDPDIVAFIELPRGSQCERNNHGTLVQVFE
jgi:hypothetical protein